MEVALDSMKVVQGDAKTGIWTDPSGCKRYIADRGNAGGLIAEDGMQICC